MLEDIQYKTITIDVVIPSFRLEEKYILPILNLRYPASAKVRFIMIADNPAISPSQAILDRTRHDGVTLLINPKNMGAAYTRNRGIDTGNSDWILLLDDDIEVDDQLLFRYTGAVRRYPEEIGFVGLVVLPPPATNFSRAIRTSGFMDLFGIAGKAKTVPWGTTANVLINRKAIGKTRFSMQYPRSGGGEDVDFFLKVRENNHEKNYRTLKEAVVYHPWWNNGKADLKRLFRYGKGNSFIGEFNPKYVYYDFLNTVETLLLIFLIAPVLLWMQPHLLAKLVIAITGVVTAEIIASWFQFIKRKIRLNITVLGYIFLIKFIYQCGLLWGNLSRLRVKGLGERYNPNGRPAKSEFFRFNSYKTAKWILYAILLFYIIR